METDNCQAVERQIVFEDSGRVNSARDGDAELLDFGIDSGSALTVNYLNGVLELATEPAPPPGYWDRT